MPARETAPLTRPDTAGTRFSLRVTPRGHLDLEDAEPAGFVAAEVEERLRNAFAQGPGALLLQLGGCEVHTPLPPVPAFWRGFAGGYMTAVCTQRTERATVAEHRVPVPASADLGTLCLTAPPMTGAEYLTVSLLGELWEALDAAFAHAWTHSRLPLADFLKSLNPAWNLVGRVHFNLAENRRDEDAPFAFLATYTAKLTTNARAQHAPLGHALREYARATHRQQLLALLVPVQRAAETCSWVRDMVESDELFHPIRWSPDEALRFLRDVPKLEAAGIIVRTPPAWSGLRPPRPQVKAIVGSKTPSVLGRDALLDFKLQVMLDGESLTPAELQSILSSTDGLTLLRGRWVEIDRNRLAQSIAAFERIEARARSGGVSFADAMRMLAGAAAVGDDGAETSDADERDWSQVAAGPWLHETLAALRSPENLKQLEPGPGFHGTLRPYQEVGIRWLHFCSQLGLGACLADDMGLGKTIQVLALLAAMRSRKGEHLPSLLVAPASLLANWQAEAARFTPGLRTLIAHPASLPAGEVQSGPQPGLAGVDLVITSYGCLLRMPWLSTTQWRLAILDEAQAIKNPAAKQTRAAKKLQAQARIVLTGTPIENRLMDLWSIFDFINPGLLGTGKHFTAVDKRLANGASNAYAPLRELVRPYILRRLKTDKKVIADLPDKTELTTFCLLTRKQAALYQHAVDDLARRLEDAAGIERRGLVLASLMRLKQICNHPSQWLGDDAWEERDSGKWSRLRELCEVIAAKQEKVLVFTQFAALTAPVAQFLEAVFARPGVVLHGATALKKRQQLVAQFQDDESVPFFVLSLKAGGTGLNLTAASHVIHFDRWWNPAVENQATDRAFRIGQKRNVLVHKFVCKGTLEERIDQLIDSKKQLSRELLDGGAEVLLTEMTNDALLKLVALDLSAVLEGV